MTSQRVGSDFTDGAALPNYINGRLLTATDLATGQATLGTHDRRLGTAIGTGVVAGLWVTAAATNVTVDPGLALAASGETVRLAAAITLPLTFATAAGPSTGPSFGCCTTAASSTGSAVAVGTYLLTALAACQLSGSAPTAPAPGSDTSSGCVAQWQVEGVQFKAISLAVGDSVFGVPVTSDNRRNLVAHWCFGTAALARLGADPFNFAPAYGGLDTVDPADLTTADVPLAVFYWNGQAVEFVDNWSVRRTITAPDPVTAAWSGVVSDRRRADGQARLLQFQDQAGDVVAAGAAGTTAAATTFPLLPPVGFLPISSEVFGPVLKRLSRQLDKNDQPLPDAGEDREKLLADSEPDMFSVSPAGVRANLIRGLSREQLEIIAKALAAASTEPGFDLDAFFGDSATCGGILDWDIADFALRQSWEAAPASTVTATFGQLAFGAPELAERTLARWRGTDAATAYLADGNKAAKGGLPAATAPLVWYPVLQNLTAASAGDAATTPTPYVVFVKNTIWIRGTQLPFLTGEQYSVRGRLRAVGDQ